MRIPLGHTTSERERRGSRRGRHGLLMGLITLVGIVPLLLAACGPGQGGASSPDPNGVFVWPYTPSVPLDASHLNILTDEVFDPAANWWYAEANTISMLFTNLVTFDSALNVVPDAAARIDVDKTGTVYTFHLRDNMKFSDGNPIQAQDFAYSIDRALDPHLCDQLDGKTYGPNVTQECGDNVGPGAYYLGGLIKGADKRLAGAKSTIIGPAGDQNAGLSVIDPQTLQIRLVKPYAFFLYALTFPTSSVVEKSFVEKKGYEGGLWVQHLDQGGCSGPFQVQSYGEGKQLTLVPNSYWEDAWGKKLQLKAVERPLVADQTQSYSDYRAGKYDFTTMEATEYSRARSQGDFVEIPSMETDYFGLNFRLPPFGEQNVRAAFDLALNKQYMVDSIEDGAAIPTNHIIPKGMPGYNTDLKNPAPDRTQSITGNQAAAQQLMKQAQEHCQDFPDGQWPAYCDYISWTKKDGSKTSPRQIDLYIRADRTTQLALGKAAAAAWNSILGVNVVVKPSPDVGKNLFSPVNPMPMWIVGWIADYPDPQDWLSLNFRTDAGNNSGGWGSKTLDIQMDKADQIQDPAARLGAESPYHNIEQALVDQCGWIPFQQQKLFWRIRPQVRGFYLNAMGMMPDISWPNVYKLKLNG